MPEERLWERQVPAIMRAQGGAPATRTKDRTRELSKGWGVPREQELSMGFPLR